MTAANSHSSGFPNVVNVDCNKCDQSIQELALHTRKKIVIYQSYQNLRH